MFSNSFSYESLLRFKDETPVYILSNIVYIFKCSQCQATYMGETTRHLHTRVADHRVFHLDLVGLFLNLRSVELGNMLKKLAMS